MLDKKEHKKNLREFRKSFTENFNALRKQKELSLDELSEQSNIPRTELEKIISGNYQNWGVIHQIARFFDCKIRIMFY
ncbi:MAG: helix-turn-helix domain-containing protein [Alphaproteobacteria bacterium]